MLPSAVGTTFADMRLQTTTMVAIVYLTSRLNVDVIFRYARTVQKGLGWRARPDGGGGCQTGTIVSLSDGGQIRGDISDSLLRRYCGAYLKNCLSVYIRTGVSRVINSKVSADKLHLCGVLSEDEASATAELFLGNVRELQRRLRYIGDLPDGARMNTLTAIRVFQGPPVTLRAKQLVTVAMLEDHYAERVMSPRRIGDDKLSALHHIEERPTTVPVTITHHGSGVVEHQVVDVIRIQWLRHRCEVGVLETRSGVKGIVAEGPVDGTVAHTICHRGSARLVVFYYEDVAREIPVRQGNVLLPLPPDGNFMAHGRVDDVLFSMFTHIHQDHTTFQGFFAAAEHLLSITHCYVIPPQIVMVRSALNNSRVALPFEVDKGKLAAVFEEEGYVVVFDNQRNDHAAIYIPYATSDNIIRKRKYDAVLIHVFASGRMTLTGPESRVNEIAFQEFMSVVRRRELDIRA